VDGNVCFPGEGWAGARYKRAEENEDIWGKRPWEIILEDAKAEKRRIHDEAKAEARMKRMMKELKEAGLQSPLGESEGKRVGNSTPTWREKEVRDFEAVADGHA
jgi:hypothetical protein